MAPAGIVAGDFTGDGHLDLAVANYGSYGSSSTVSVLLGNGDGTFQPAVNYAAGWALDAIVAGDFSDDGRIDLAVANSASNDVSILLGNGDGTFQSDAVGQTHAADAVGSNPVAIVAGDFNGDGRTDLAVANYSSNDVSVLLGNGDGTFQPAVQYAVGSSPEAIVAGDFNGDGRTDLAVLNQGTWPDYRASVSVLLGNGDGTFQPAVEYAVPPLALAIVAGDFTGNGRTDLAVVDLGSVDSPWAGPYVSILLGNGDGTFQPAVQYTLGFYPDAIVAGDFTGNGRTDLAVADYGQGDPLGAAGQRRRHVPASGAVHRRRESRRHRGG